MRRALLIILLVTSACGTTPAATPSLPPPQISTAARSATPLSAATAAARPSPLPAATPAEPVTVSIPVDGATLAAAYYAPALSAQTGAGSAPGVVLLHMLGRTRADWDAFARELQKYGIAALAVDLRGHGASSGPQDWARAPGDVRAAWDWLAARPEVDRAATALVGASIGANLALIAGANNSDVATVVALSPGLDYRGVQPAPVLANFGSRPVFFLASQDDSYAYDSVRQMAGQTAGGDTHYFTSAGHGTDMFRDPALQGLLLDWLTKQLGVVKG